MELEPQSPAAQPASDPAPEDPGGSRDRPPAASGPASTPMPVADLIGLRFSLLHLRLVGYGVMAVWLTELLSLITSPNLTGIAPRLHYISLLLDRSPLLLVGIGLIAFHGGVRRHGLERLFLPLLLALLPLLSAFHFFLAPVSVANALTLIAKQEQIGKGQLRQIERQLDRAADVLAESEDLDVLLRGLESIPGLQVQVASRAQGSLEGARQEVRGALRQERQRVRERVSNVLSQARAGFWRRALINAALAMAIGLILFAVYSHALREMEQALPYLDWAITSQVVEHPLVLVDLAEFQRSCLNLSIWTLLDRLVRIVRPRRAEEEEQAEDLQVQELSEELITPPQYPSPFPSPRLSILQGGPPPLFSGPPPMAGMPAVSPEDEEDFDSQEGEDGDWSDRHEPPGLRERWEEHRRDRDRRRARQALQRMADSPMFQDLQQPSPEPASAATDGPQPAPPPLGLDLDLDVDSPHEPEPEFEDPHELSPAERRARERDVRRSRAALQRMADEELFPMFGEQPPPGALSPPRPSPLGRLWRWFVTHL